MDLVSILNLPNSYRSYFTHSLGFLCGKICNLKIGSCFFLAFQSICFWFLFFLTSLAKTSSSMLNSSCKSGYLCLFPILGGKYLAFNYQLMLAIGTFMNMLFFFFFFFFFLASPWHAEVLGQESSLHHSSGLGHCINNAKSLTY